mmetsp:Transcript_38296/g.90833  ORF Transcript_38296/g.90833 Transcript_38296/m.90833 type:complete len:217 (+) Transcript_38296:962-1612(+)
MRASSSSQRCLLTRSRPISLGSGGPSTAHPKRQGGISMLQTSCLSGHGRRGESQLLSVRPMLRIDSYAHAQSMPRTAHRQDCFSRYLLAELARLQCMTCRPAYPGLQRSSACSLGSGVGVAPLSSPKRPLTLSRRMTFFRRSSASFQPRERIRSPELSMPLRRRARAPLTVMMSGSVFGVFLNPPVNPAASSERSSRSTSMKSFPTARRCMRLSSP